ncbi:hypothetical protein M9434_000125 [Picochlorum sp. BPE23]|nr:hypothetical protein M9434_000125 [Picochlorum sp. BPE23]
MKYLHGTLSRIHAWSSGAVYSRKGRESTNKTVAGIDRLVSVLGTDQGSRRRSAEYHQGWRVCSCVGRRSYTHTGCRRQQYRMGLFHSTQRSQQHAVGSTWMNGNIHSSSVDDGGSIWLIVGLGNPGPKYAHHRHNVGFMAVDEIAKAHGISLERLQKNCHVGRGYICDRKVLLAKPMTFMNNSGEGVSKLLEYYKIPLSNLIVLYDDLDTNLGSVRLRAKGGHGGQNGMRSIIDCVGSNGFARVKIGIGRPEPGRDVVSHVLNGFRQEEKVQVEKDILPRAVETVQSVLVLGMEKASSGVRVDVHGDVIKR